MEMTIDPSFASGVQELSIDEIDNVNGGIAPLIVAAIVVGGVIVVGFAAGAIAGYVANS